MMTPPSFPVSWSHYVKLLARSRSPEALAFYHAEALRGGWSVRQLDRQIATQFYERTALSKDKAAMLAHEVEPRARLDVISWNTYNSAPMPPPGSREFASSRVAGIPGDDLTSDSRGI